jgi:hypothetical protein
VIQKVQIIDVRFPHLENDAPCQAQYHHKLQQKVLGIAEDILER